MIIKRCLSLAIFTVFFVSIAHAEITLQMIEDAIVRKYGKQTMIDFASSKYIKTKPQELRSPLERTILRRVDDVTVRDVSTLEAFAIYRFINSVKHMSQFSPATKAQIIRELVVKCNQFLHIKLSDTTYLDPAYYNSGDNYNISALGYRLSPAERAAQAARDQAEIAALNLKLAAKKREAARRATQGIY